MGQTVVEKVAQRHLTEGPDRPLRAGDMISLRPRHVLTHDNTAAVIRKFESLGARRVYDARQPVFVLDHEIQNQSPENLAKYEMIGAFAAVHGIDFYPAGIGIGHQIMVEKGYAAPGALVVASDSHANMYGAVGALGTPIVRTDAAGVWATGSFWWQVPPTIQVVLEGELPEGTSGKDVILALCGMYSHDEVLNCALEFTGPGVAALDVAARMSIANMTTEWGALTGWFPVDDVTLAYLRAHHGTRDIARPMPDADAVYAGRIVFDLATLVPQVAGPDAVQTVRAASEVATQGVPIQKAYLLSCVNGRLEDLEAAAAVLRGKHVADGVDFYFAAASRRIQEAALQRGVWQVLLDAGAHPLPPGCGPCIGLGQGLLQNGETGISATNRNFKGRMGARDAQVYLASPRVVATSAIAGRIADGDLPASPQPYRFDKRTTDVIAETVAILPGFPESAHGRLLFVPRDNLNTDGIYGKDYTYRELTRAEMSAVVMQNYDNSFALRVKPGDILVGTRNFGTGSSREQAATALQACGIGVVIASSFSQTYLRNAFNNGLVCIEAPAFVDQVTHDLEHEIAAGTLTIITDPVAVDFAHSTIRWRGRTHGFPALGSVPQSLIAAGGIEQLLRKQLHSEKH